MTYLYAGLLGMALAVTVRIGLPGLPLLLAVAGLLVMRILRTLRRRDQETGSSPRISKASRSLWTYAIRNGKSSRSISSGWSERGLKSS